MASQQDCLASRTGERDEVSMSHLARVYLRRGLAEHKAMQANHRRLPGPPTGSL